MCCQCVKFAHLKIGSCKFFDKFQVCLHPLTMSLDCQISLNWHPPKFSNPIHFARNVFRSWGLPVWDSNIFLKSATYRPTLIKLRGCQLKKSPCALSRSLFTSVQCLYFLLQENAFSSLKNLYLCKV